MEIESDLEDPLAMTHTSRSVSSLGDWCPNLEHSGSGFQTSDEWCGCLACRYNSINWAERLAKRTMLEVRSQLACLLALCQNWLLRISMSDGEMEQVWDFHERDALRKGRGACAESLVSRFPGNPYFETFRMKATSPP
jgi:hypothetical protein